MIGLRTARKYVQLRESQFSNDLQMEIFLNSIIGDVKLIAMTLGSLKTEVVCVSYGFYKIQGFFSKLAKIDRRVGVRTWKFASILSLSIRTTFSSTFFIINSQIFPHLERPVVQVEFRLFLTTLKCLPHHPLSSN